MDAPTNISGELGQFVAQAIPHYDQYRIAKDAKGLPCVLISTTELFEQAHTAPIELKNLSVLQNVECRVSPPDGHTEEGRFTVICCTGHDRSLHGVFLRVAGALISTLGVQPTEADIAIAVRTFVDLFRSLDTPSRKSTRGLWAELFLIARSSNPERLIEAWHLMPEDRYDFNSGNQRIEVKSSSSRVRTHHFSHEQLHPPSGTTALVASIFVELAGAGTSISELIDAIVSQLSQKPDLVLHIEQTIGRTLGENWTSASRDRFDYELAKDSLRFYNASVVPSTPSSLPEGVSEVRFRSDLTSAPTAKPEEYTIEGGLFEAAI